MRLGLDIGSTTIKAVVLNDNDEIVYKSYERHYSRVLQKMAELLKAIADKFSRDSFKISISGSAAMGIADTCGITFVQEVFAQRACAKKYAPDTDVIIELGGEDAKLVFLSGGEDSRMNGTCAGGTGSFIDQMASLLNVSADELNELAASYERLYIIASRCGVFAKSDIQPLINQGARREDIAASIFRAVVNQTVGGLAQGRKIKGNILYLGGPLTFLSELRNSFDEVLGIKGVCPENSLYFVAVGAAMYANDDCSICELTDKLNRAAGAQRFGHLEPLFNTEEEYEEFSERHGGAKVKSNDMDGYSGQVYIGVDAGSTTIKFAVIGEDGSLLHSVYESNSGNPVPKVKNFLLDLYEKYPGVNIGSSAVTGYGEALIKNAFSFDMGLVETVAHFTAAKEFLPEVDFIIDIGGQDMKCLKIHNGAIDNIYLNEACSSGCGSFLQTFADSMDIGIDEFAKLGLFADKPVDLGSRCTVFMNSSVKQAQKDGASTENISAGLSMSIVKNALYKVIRPSSTEELGKHIVVQGGTFYNDAVLRAFEKELDMEVVRPNISGLMGAYGAALYAKGRAGESSGIIKADALKKFTHEVSSVNCRLCQNNCLLTVNRFADGRRFISGNRCERPVTGKDEQAEYNHYTYKRAELDKYCNNVRGDRPVIGIPRVLNMYELLPFWYSFFHALGFDVIVSPVSDRELYLSGQSSIPSDTVCFPAKLTHGHIGWLIEQEPDAIFYPCMGYNVDEHMGDNCYNCPVVAYYPEVLGANVPELHDAVFINGYVGLHHRRQLPDKLFDMLYKYFPKLKKTAVKQAVDKGYDEYEAYMRRVRDKGNSIIEKARQAGKPVVVLAGRPYHIDRGINHGMDKLITSMGAAVVGEDAAASNCSDKPEVAVLNQWTYHSRLYNAARFASGQKDIQFVQLVNFGCGCDAITTDECRSILEDAGKIYTQIKIDEIENLGAAKIRLRSLFAAAGINEG